MDNNLIEQTTAMFAAQMQTFMEKTTLPGLTFAFFDEKGLLNGKSLGVKDVETKEPVDFNTTGLIGSVSKTFCALATMICIERKLISLHDPIDKYLPVTFMIKDHPITIHHLLSQTSGIRDLGLSVMHILKPLKLKLETIPDVLVDNSDEYIEFINGATEFIQEPGEYCYCNSNFTLLSLIIEQVSGLTYEEFLQQNIFDPLKMVHTSFDTNDMPNHFTLYHVHPNEKNEWIHEPHAYKMHRLIAGAGGISSCISDMITYGSLYLNEGKFEGKQIISPSLINQMFTKVQICDEITEFGPKGIGINDAGGYGYGWFVCDDFFGEKLVLHLGELIISSSLLMLLPQRKMGIVEIDNTGDISSIEIETAFAALAMILGKNPMEDFPIVAASAFLENLAGNYTGYKNFNPTKITLKGSTLYLSDYWTIDPEPLHPIDDGMFCTEYYTKTTPAGKGKVKFILKDDGRVFLRYSKLLLRKRS